MFTTAIGCCAKISNNDILTDVTIHRLEVFSYTTTVCKHLNKWKNCITLNVVRKYIDVIACFLFIELTVMNIFILRIEY